VGLAGLAEVLRPRGVIGLTNLEPAPEIVIQDDIESDQVLCRNFVCAASSPCTGNEADSLEGKVASKVDMLERKVDKLTAQNAMLIEMLQKLDQHRD